MDFVHAIVPGGRKQDYNVHEDRFTPISDGDELEGAELVTWQYSKEHRELVPFSRDKDAPEIQVRALTAQALVENQGKLYLMHRPKESRPRFVADQWHLFFGHPMMADGALYRIPRTTPQMLQSYEWSGMKTVKDALHEYGIRQQSKMLRVGSIIARGEGHEGFFGLVYLVRGVMEEAQGELSLGPMRREYALAGLDDLDDYQPQTKFTRIIRPHLEDILEYGRMNL